MYEARDVSVLLGETLVDITQFENKTLYFTTLSGRKYMMYHANEYTESVEIESIVGALDDLIGVPLLLSEAVSYSNEDEHYTWTFYKFATRKGYVDIRWYGSSNGFYSERVDFIQVE